MCEACTGSCTHPWVSGPRQGPPAYEAPVGSRQSSKCPQEWSTSSVRAARSASFGIRRGGS